MLERQGRGGDRIVARGYGRQFAEQVVPRNRLGRRKLTQHIHNCNSLAHHIGLVEPIAFGGLARQNPQRFGLVVPCVLCEREEYTFRDRWSRKVQMPHDLLDGRRCAAIDDDGMRRLQTLMCQHLQNELDRVRWILYEEPQGITRSVFEGKIVGQAEGQL